MATVEVCIDGNGEFVKASTVDLPALVAGDMRFIWIDVDPSDMEEVRFIQDQFDLHRIAVDNAIEGPNRARIMLFDDQIYVRSFGLRKNGHEVLDDPICLFCGDRFLVTLRTGQQPSLRSIQDRWREEVRRKREHAARQTSSVDSHAAVLTSVKLLYTVLDELVDDYFLVVEGIAEDVEALEDLVMGDDHSRHHITIQGTRSRINRLHRMLSPLQEVFNTLMRRDVPVIDEAAIPYFADVHDHLLRCHEWLDTCRDQIASIVDLQQSIQANQLNRTMRTLTAWSIVLMVSGLVAGIYGMNFRDMPELGWRLGYPGALFLMLLLSVTLALLFKRLRWW